MTTFYLASTSPARLATLRAAGIEPVVVPSQVDEPAAVAAAEQERGPLSAAETVLLLARAKAEAIVSQDIDGIIFGGDSALELAGQTLGKPHLPAVARARITAMRGTTGTLHSGHWLIDHRGGSVQAATGATAGAQVTFGDITDEEIDAYVATGEPLEVAGSFTIDGLGSAFVRSIVGDPSCVVGMSMPTVRDLASELGIFWPDLWNRD